MVEWKELKSKNFEKGEERRRVVCLWAMSINIRIGLGRESRYIYFRDHGYRILCRWMKKK